jgi:aspartate oxidase
MKKYSQIIKSKNTKRWKRGIKSRKKKTERNKKNQGLNKKQRKVENYLKQNWDVVKVVAPKNFSFVKNTIQVAKFINQLSECYEKNKEVYVVLKQIEILNYDALVVIAKTLSDKKAIFKFQGL